MISKRAQLNISFGWLFAIIIGAAILALTIYGVTKMVKTSGSEQQIIGAKDLGILLNPLETGFESASSTPLTTNVDTKIYNDCNEAGDFGTQKLSLSEYTFKEWGPPGGKISFKNKYIFSKNIVEGKNFYVLSKPFSFPFKVSDIMILTSSKDKYCFDNAPQKIEEEILNLNQINLAPNCSGEYSNYTKVCFSDNCEIMVNLNENIVKKGNENLDFYVLDNDYSLMYAAIFSDKENYDCQIQRLLKRTKILAELYNEKISLENQRGCNNGLSEELNSLINTETSRISDLDYLVNKIKNENENSECRLW